jgi:hypothetical protein
VWRARVGGGRVPHLVAVVYFARELAVNVRKSLAIEPAPAGPQGHRLKQEKALRRAPRAGNGKKRTSSKLSDTRTDTNAGFTSRGWLGHADRHSGRTLQLTANAISAGAQDNCKWGSTCKHTGASRWGHPPAAALCWTPATGSSFSRAEKSPLTAASPAPPQPQATHRPEPQVRHFSRGSGGGGG